MTAANKLKFLAVLPCDEIRREDNGKFLLIGTYATNIRFTNIPGALSLSLLVIADALETGEHSLEFRAKIGDRIIYETRGARITTSALGRSLIPLRNVVI